METEPNNVNNGAAFVGAPADVLLFPTMADALAYCKRMAAANPKGLAGVAVGMFETWAGDLWELVGDGRALVTAAQRELLMERALLDAMCEDAASDAAPGTAALAARCVRQAAGLQEFERVLDAARSGERDNRLEAREWDLAAVLARYRLLLGERGLIELGEALAWMAERADAVFPHEVRVRLVDAAPLDCQRTRFFEACPQIRLDADLVEGAESVRRAPGGIDVRFAFASGPLAEPGLIADQVKHAVAEGNVLIACKNPLDLYKRIAFELACADILCAVRASVPFGETDFGRMFLALRRCLTVEPWDPALLTDVLLSPLSGVSKRDARDLDAHMRSNRLVAREGCLSALRAASERFSLLEELASDPDADVLIGAFEDAIARMGRCSEAYRAEQRAALKTLRGVLFAARSAGVDMEAASRLLERAQVDVSRVFAASPQRMPAVTIMSQTAAASCGPRSCTTLIVANLTGDDYLATDTRNAATTLLARLGIEPVDSALARARRTFNRLLHVPMGVLIVERALHGPDAADSYPCAVWEEFVDAYRADPSATDDIDNVYSLPDFLQTGLVERGEELLYANARAACETRAQQITAAHPRAGKAVVGESARARVLLSRPDSSSRPAEKPYLSPSQIEAYLECPHQWFLQRRLHLEEMGEGFGPLERGNFAHAALERFYLRFRQEVGPKVTPGTLEVARRLMGDVLDELERQQYDQEPGLGRLVAATYLERREAERFKRQLMGFLDFEVNLLPSFHPLHLEFPLEAAAFVEYAGCNLVGRIDRIDVDDKGRAVIIDYKGSLNGRFSIADKDDAYLGKVQTRIYAQAVRRLLGLDVVGALYVSYGRIPQVSGAYDALALDAAHLPGCRPDKCGCGTGHLPAFSDMLDWTEQRIGDAVAALVAGDVDPAPAHRDVCAYCPAVDCAKRGM